MQFRKNRVTQVMKILNQRTRGAWLTASLLFAFALCPQAFAETVTNSYDTLNRLTSVVYGNGQQINYTYDAAGNRTAMSGNTLTAPTAFTFTPQTNVALNTQIASNTIPVSGVNAAPPITITGGEYSINGGTYTTAPGAVNNGDTVTVRLTSAATNNTTLAATLTIGGVSGTFNVTTLPPATGAVSLSATSLTFTSQAQGTTSVAQTVMLTNNSTATLTISGIAISAGSSDFTKTSAGTCGSTVAAGASCTITVTFTPSAVGARTGTVTIISDAVGSPHTVSLSGTGATPAGLASFTDNFDGTSLQSAYWKSTGVGAVNVSGGIVNFGCNSQADTGGKYQFSGSQIIIEGRFSGAGGLRDTKFILGDTSNVNNLIFAGDTSYQGQGLYTAGSGDFVLSQVGNGNSISAYKEYRLTIAGTSLTWERGDTLANITETITRTLPNSIVGKSFFLYIGTGGPDYCPGSFDWVHITSDTATTLGVATIPDAPTIGTAIGGNAQATVSFTAPANNGGSAITAYTVTSNPAGITASGTTSPISVTGLTNGTTYTFTVNSTNAIGNSAESAASNSVTPTPASFTVSTSAAANGSITPATQTVTQGNTTSFTITANAGYSASASGCGGSLSGSTYTTGTVTVNCTVTATFTQNAISTQANLVAGWNLLGNSIIAPLDVTTVFVDASTVTTVWKWVPATSKWAFYAPLLAANQTLTSYAAGKGYDVLDTVKGGEGFWVNAKSAFTVQLPTGVSIATGYFQPQLDTTQNKLISGWNLIATGDNVTPSLFNQGLSVTQPAQGVIPQNVITLWAWDSVLSNWYFYAPSMEVNGGLANYITTKGYLDFTDKGKTLDPTTGFWVNRTTASAVTTSKLNDTGITASQCYQAGSDTLVACNSSGALALNNAQDGMAGRDANIVTNSNTDGKLGFSFTNVTGGCVQDNVTGLMWEVKTTDGGLRDKNKTYTNYSTTYNPSNLYGTATDASGFVAAVNATNLCGYSDWRLPTADELQSIVDYSVASPGPVIDATWFPNTQDYLFWSASPYVGDSSSAWVVIFYYGVVSFNVRTETYYVRLVRAGQ
jgi:YD repeat-containing protein